MRPESLTPSFPERAGERSQRLKGDPEEAGAGWGCLGRGLTRTAPLP